MNIEINRVMEKWSTQAENMKNFMLQELDETGAVWEDLLREHLDGSMGKKALDVGCGTGFLAILLARSGWEVTAIDSNRAMIRQAEQVTEALNLSNKITFRVEDTESVDLADDSFDAVVSRHVSWLFIHPEKAYREWVRVLKPNGILLNMDANWLHPIWQKEVAGQFESDEMELIRKYGHFEDYYHDAQMMDALKKLPLTWEQRPKWDEMICGKVGLKNISVQRLNSEQYWNAFLAQRYRSIPTFLLKAQKEEKNEGGTIHE